MLTSARRRLPGSAPFGVVTAALVLVFFASGSPIPLYNSYRVEDGLSNADLAITTVLYLATTATTLLVAGRLSNHLGRRPVAIGTVLIASGGCVLFLNVHDVGTLVTARMLQGLACGLASTTLGAYVIDTAPPRPAWLPATITSNAPPFAIPLGALVAGTLAQYAPLPRVLTFSVVGAALLVVAVLLAFCPETVTRSPGAIASLRPRVLIPRGTGRLFFAAGAAFVAGWSISGFYQAFAPTLTADHLGTSNALVIAVVFSSIVLLSPLGGALSGRMLPATAVRAGLAVFAVAVVAIVYFVHAGQIIPFLLVSFIAGAAQGVSSTGGMRAVLAGATTEQRSGVLATVYLISYSGAAVPGLIAGQLSAIVPLDTLVLGYGAISVAAAIVSVTVIRNPGTEIARAVRPST